MKVSNKIDADGPALFEEPAGLDDLFPLMAGETTNRVDTHSFAGIVIGELIAMRDDTRTPLVLFPGQVGGAAVAARSVVDLHTAHIGRQVTLMFEGGDATRPIIIGVLGEGQSCPITPSPGQVEVHADGRRVIVSAAEELVLMCGRASITLTKAGKVVIRGTYVSSRSAGVNRIKGGSVQIN